MGASLRIFSIFVLTHLVGLRPPQDLIWGLIVGPSNAKCWGCGTTRGFSQGRRGASGAWPLEAALQAASPGAPLPTLPASAQTPPQAPPSALPRVLPNYT